VAYLKKSFDAGAAIINSKGQAGLAQTLETAESHDAIPLADLAFGLIEQSAEHYGRLVVYYRVA
jgi:hypothetical protein